MKVLDKAVLFESQDLGQNLARRSVQGGMTTVGAQGLQFVMRIASTVILARLLTPADYGLISMVTVVVNFAAMFKDAGLSMATVQKGQISHEQISTLFWLNSIISALIGLCVCAASPLVALFYGKPELTAVTAALSASFLVSGLTIQHKALLRRHMRFSTLAGIQIAEQTINLVTAIILASLGLRYWALVGGTLMQALSDALITFFFCRWVPGRMKRRTGVREMLKFGVHVSGFNLINYFSRNLDNILVGKFIGAQALGLYAKAYNLFLMPVSQIGGPINNVALPAICAIRDNPERYREYYRKVIFTVAFCNMPLVMFMVVFSDNIILLALGEQWYAASRIFQVLAATAFFQSVTQVGRGLPLMSMGFSKRYFHFGVLQSIVTCSGMVAGLPWGAVGVAAGYGIGFCLLIPFTLSWCLKGSPATVRDWLRAAYCPFIGSLFMVLLMVWIKSILTGDADVLELPLYENLKIIVSGGITGAVLYMLIILLLPVGRGEFTGIMKQMKSGILKRKK